MASNEEGRQINTVAKNQKIPHSHFTLNKRVGLTSVFGKNVPIYCREFVNDDGPVTIEPNCDIRSYTLKAPMIGTIKKHVSAYQVPIQAILPFNWEKIVKNPSRGTDTVGESAVTGIVPCLDGVNTVLSDFSTRIFTSFTNSFNKYKVDFPTVPITGNTVPVFILETLTFILKYEVFLSEGSLIAHLGAHFGSPYYFLNTTISDKQYSYDEYVELLLSNIVKFKFGVTDSDGNMLSVSSGVKHVRRVLDFMRSHLGPFTIDSASAISTTYLDPDDFTFSTRIVINDSEPYNYGRCCAYQIVNAHYFTNDKIDYINTAELYRQYISSLLVDFDPYSTYLTFPQSFTYNGVVTQYDYLSGLYVSEVLDSYFVTSISTASLEYWNYLVPFVQAIFGFNYSLRYMDYFVGARPRNLAVGDTSVRVDNNTVQVVDVTKNIVKQRFLNAVGRIGNTIEEYSDKILGRRLEYDYHNPKFLFSFDADVFSTEVENTGEAQQTKDNSVTAVLRGNFKNHRFTFSVDRYSYVILIEYTDFARFYHTTQERMTMAIDRFDMFVPELQYVGDQELRRSELIAGSTKEVPFGYQLRDMQFKQAYDECLGGFVDFLPGWLMKYNPYDRISNQSSSGFADIVISPAFIRSEPEELDDFYLSLTNMSLAGYFHFIEMWDIKVSAKRPMAYAPQIL